MHRISLDLNGCRPEDVNISVKDNVVSIFVINILRNGFINLLGILLFIVFREPLYPYVIIIFQVTVEAKMEYKGDGSRLYQEWSQQYTLPEKVDTKNLKSILNKDGILRVEVPVSQSIGETQTETEIPIHNKS